MATAKRASKQTKKKTSKVARAPSSPTTGTKSKVAYDESTIQSLDPLAHIRLRTGMYIGRIGDGSHPSDGIYVLLKEIIDNAVDEFIMGEGKRIEIVREDDAVTVRDYGRGIPLGKVVECVSRIHTGGKYNDDVFQFSVGLNGVGTKAVNALSEQFEVCSWRTGKYTRAEFSRGQMLEESSGRHKDAKNGTLVAFTPDREIFGDYRWDEDFIERRLRYYVYLNSGLTLTYNRRTFKSKHGLKDLLDEELGDEPSLYDIVHCKADRLEFSFTHTHNYGENYFSFVNGQYTIDGGTHQSAFREGVLKAINEFSGKSFAGEDVRDGLLGAIAIKLQNPVFESQTKNKLGSTDMRQWLVPELRKAIVLWLHQHEAEAQKLLDKVRANERIRKELASIKKEARERARKTAIRIPKLIDCKIHLTDNDLLGEQSTIFLTEGDSAGGSMVQARQVDTQAIFALKGKPLNCYGLKRDALYKNEELYNMMRALGIEESLEGLRYNKVVIATDADVDGMHIRNLLLTYFLRFFEQLVIGGHVYILETPLFRVRDRKQTRYCFSEQERDVALEDIPKAEVTRFKGLGEISPAEFKQFIGGDDMRLVQVDVKSMSEVSGALEFLMGKNTPQRKEFIVDNLITDEPW